MGLQPFMVQELNEYIKFLRLSIKALQLDIKKRKKYLNSFKEERKRLINASKTKSNHPRKGL